MIREKLKNKRILLASSSPRRQQLLAAMDVPFSIINQHSDETYPPTLQAHAIAEYLSEKKAAQIIPSLQPNDILITADTIVWHQQKILNKPGNKKEALAMLSELSDATHIVYTGVTIASADKKITFHDSTEVTFAPISQKEMQFYIQQYPPFDKAGAYGAQDWLGLTKIISIKGSYFNVMGLPTHKVYETLLNFL